MAACWWGPRYSAMNLIEPCLIAGRRCLQDARATAALEFALVGPLMLLLYFGGVELTQGVMLNRQVALTAATIAGIVSQYTTISASGQLSDILQASTQIMAGYSGPGPQVVVSLITIDASGHATVTWSRTLNGVARSQGAPIAVPANLDVPSTSLILSEASYSYV